MPIKYFPRPITANDGSYDEAGDDINTETTRNPAGAG